MKKNFFYPWSDLKITDRLGCRHPHSAEGYTEAQSREGVSSKARAEQELGLGVGGYLAPHSRVGALEKEHLSGLALTWEKL